MRYGEGFAAVLQLVIRFIRRESSGLFRQDHGFRSTITSRLQLPKPNGHFGTAATSGTHVLGKLLQRRLNGFAGKVRTGLGNDQVFAVVEHHRSPEAPSMLTVGV